MSAKHILKLAVLFKNAVFDHKPEDMCCGGTMVRKDCPYHKDEKPKHYMHHMLFRDTNTSGVMSGSVISTSGNPPNVADKVVIDKVPSGIGNEISLIGEVINITEQGDHTIVAIRFDQKIPISGSPKRMHLFLWYPI